jgi:hypothetical protein
MPSNNPPATAPAQNDEAVRLRAENAELREQLAAAQADAIVRPNTKPKPVEPSYGLSEGQRADLEVNGKTVSPFTGARQVGDGTPGEKPRVVSAEEFDKR